MSYRLNVPYNEKDEAKRYGAKWNFSEKYWYCSELTDDLRRWYEGAETEQNTVLQTNTQTNTEKTGDASNDPQTISLFLR